MSTTPKPGSPEYPVTLKPNGNQPWTVRVLRPSAA